MHPILARFNIGGTEVVLRAYSTFYVLAFIVAVVVGTLVARRRGFSWWRALLTFSLALTIGVAGARLLDLAVNWAYYAEDTHRIYQFAFRGFALDGGLILALVAGALLARAFRQDVWRLADGAVPSLMAGIVFMRTGCFLQGCCFGTTTSLPWAVTFPVGSPAWTQQFLTGQKGVLSFAAPAAPVHPTELYEILAALVAGGLALWLSGGGRSGRIASGVPFLVFALGFTLFRLADTFLRAQPPTFALPGWVYPTFFGVVAAGVAAVIAWRTRASRLSPSRSQGGGDDGAQ